MEVAVMSMKVLKIRMVKRLTIFEPNSAAFDNLNNMNNSTRSVIIQAIAIVRGLAAKMAIRFKAVIESV